MKRIVILFSLMFVLTGCNFLGMSVVRMKTDNIDNILNVVLSKENDLYNKTGKGYKYYKPMGVASLNVNGYNERLYSNGNYYYLYVDINAYYYKKEINYVEDPNLYYSRKIDMNGKQGYLQISEKKDNMYFIEYVYNYSRIEALVEKEDINRVVLDATYILSSIKYNGNVIRLEETEEFISNVEEQYDKFKNNGEYNFTEEE